MGGRGRKGFGSIPQRRLQPIVSEDFLATAGFLLLLLTLPESWEGHESYREPLFALLLLSALFGRKAGL